MTRSTRPVSWLSAALKDFETFPEGARSICLAALTIAAEGGKADIAQPLKGMGSGVFEIALRYRTDAFRAVMQFNSAMTFGSCMRFRRNRLAESRLLNTTSI